MKESTEPQILCCPGELAEHWGKAGREFPASTFSVPGKQKCSHCFARIAFVQKTLTLVQKEEKAQSPRFYVVLESLQSTGERQAENLPDSAFSEAEVFTLLRRIAFVQKTVTLVQNERKHRAPDSMLSWRACRALGKGRQRIPC